MCHFCPNRQEIDPMPRLTRLHQRAGIFQLRIVVPKALQARFGGRLVRKSLRTSDRPEAELLATVERARLLALFATTKKSSDCLQHLSTQTQKVLEPLQGILAPWISPASVDLKVRFGISFFQPLFLGKPSSRSSLEQATKNGHQRNAIKFQMRNLPRHN